MVLSTREEQLWEERSTFGGRGPLPLLPYTHRLYDPKQPASLPRTATLSSVGGVNRPHPIVFETETKLRAVLGQVWTKGLGAGHQDKDK